MKQDQKPRVWWIARGYEDIITTVPPSSRDPDQQDFIKVIAVEDLKPLFNNLYAIRGQFQGLNGCSLEEIDKTLAKFKELFE